MDQPQDKSHPRGRVLAEGLDPYYQPFLEYQPELFPSTRELQRNPDTGEGVFHAEIPFAHTHHTPGLADRSRYDSEAQPRASGISPPDVPEFYGEHSTGGSRPVALLDGTTPDEQVLEVSDHQNMLARCSGVDITCVFIEGASGMSGGLMEEISPAHLKVPAMAFGSAENKGSLSLPTRPSAGGILAVSESNDLEDNRAPFSMKCEQCGKILTGAHAPGNMTRHKKSEGCLGSVKKLRHDCPVPGCSKTYARSDGAKAHVRKHHSQSPGPQPADDDDDDAETNVEFSQISWS